MKVAVATLLFAAGASAHTIFREVAVNGVWQGDGNGLRLPSYNGPIENVLSESVVCNGSPNPITSRSPNKISVRAGDQISLRWVHAPGSVIDASHKGPIMVYMSKVSNALTDTPNSGWFKIYEDGLGSDGKWAVDKLIAANGVVTVTIPSCIAPGDYLFRGELIALHAAGNYPGAQLYMECAQFSVTSSGSSTFSGVSFPGAYSGSDPGIRYNLYSGQRTYTIPGPRPISCSGGNPQPTTTTQPPRTTTTTQPPRTTTTTPFTTRTSVAPAPTTTTRTTTQNNGGSGAPLYGQCGGRNWAGATTCAQGTCKFSNEWYSQCLP
ncbi:hypothetical protein HK097_003048 [Rhizophlyctis rosea]|uniref:AA9 family lytic polysaccharide monooxygenase n=1 Tax=Rhizophlyctis rosea TaxID=64517 RepID=A0AAD5X504_9FUNG|nr:hypothetical protein HK097_003048 [Rhizophlyctis rosea]